MDSDLDVFVCLRERKREGTDTTTDVDDSRIFLERELCVSGDVSTACHVDGSTYESGLLEIP